MKLKILILLILLVACKNASNTENLAPIKRADSLFLSFYPGMDEQEFEKMLLEPNNKKVLSNGRYIIKVDTIDLLFKVAVNQYSVQLRLLKDTVRPPIFSEKPGELYNDVDESSFYKSRYKSIITGLAKILENKYSDELNIESNFKVFSKQLYLPKDRFSQLFIQNLGANNNAFFIFRKDSKVVVLSYNMYGKGLYRKPSLSKIANQANKLSKDDQYEFSRIQQSLLQKVKPTWYEVNMGNDLNKPSSDIRVASVNALTDDFETEFQLHCTIHYLQMETFKEIVEEVSSRIRSEENLKSTEINDKRKIEAQKAANISNL